ncbi:GNAT family N-acetyltransferase [Jeotgalibacillus sp. ET6]|uniref:GNAT family N-acetyltransferase n=1 Tax=Jeotgalibacillus sp. ET6 TaxID=3037260 RepID=UPI0024182191|nr:GNAT family N-acetyltransferase [Jeotgalibacillus sp. ET6]MDG5472184.1 GNAT family N-acetyltransferase [Jeotgalibacillus sp. ET6]
MNAKLLDFPDQFETDRLIIRSAKPGDGVKVWGSVNASRQELKPWLPFASHEATVEETEINIRESYINFLAREDLRLLVFLKETGEFVASSGLHRINWDVRKFEIGYWIDSRMSGRGYMTEAVEGIARFAFNSLNAQRVEIRCDAENSKSRAIPEKLGFKLEGILQNNDINPVTKKLIDTCVYAKVRQAAD